MEKLNVKLFFDAQSNAYYIKDGGEIIECRTKVNTKDNIINKLYNTSVDSTAFEGKELTKLINMLINSCSERIHGLTYQPSMEEIIEYNGLKFLNKFKASKYMFQDSVVADKNVTTEDFPHIYKLISHICGYDKEALNFLLAFLSNKLLYPAEKKPLAIVIIGYQGSGKSTFVETLITEIFGDQNINYPISEEDILSQFNEYQAECLFCGCAEITELGHNTNTAERFKEDISGKTFYLNNKHEKKRKYPNMANIILMSNSRNPVKMDADDRRYFVISNFEKQDMAEFFSSYYNHYKSEIPYFVQYLIDLGVNELPPIPKSEVKKEAKDRHKNSIQLFIDELSELGPFSMLDQYQGEYVNKYIDGKSLENICLINYIPKFKFSVSSSVFYKLYQDFCDVNGIKVKSQNKNFCPEISNNSWIEKKKISQGMIYILDYTNTINDIHIETSFKYKVKRDQDEDEDFEV